MPLGFLKVYWGTWAPTTATCKNEEKSVIVLSAHTYASSATSCTVNYVRTTPGPKGPTCSARLQCSNPTGQTDNKTTANLIIRPGDAPAKFSSAPSSLVSSLISAVPRVGKAVRKTHNRLEISFVRGCRSQDRCAA
jgi:hypothetical protein